MIFVFSVAHTFKSASRARGGTAITELARVSGVIAFVFITLNKIYFEILSIQITLFLWVILQHGRT
jgi:hypothetical protein